MTPDWPHPLLFLDIDDIDGTLLPFGGDTTREPPEARADSYLDRLNPKAGLRLTALRCDLICATTWEHEASVGPVNVPDQSPSSRFGCPVLLRHGPRVG